MTMSSMQKHRASKQKSAQSGFIHSDNELSAHGPEPQRKVSNISYNPCYKGLQLFETNARPYLVLVLFLMKCPTSVYLYIQSNIAIQVLRSGLNSVKQSLYKCKELPSSPMNIPPGMKRSWSRGSSSEPVRLSGARIPSGGSH